MKCNTTKGYLIKNNLEDVKDALIKDLKDISIENGKESTQRILGSILKKHNVDFDHITQNNEYLSVYKENTTIGNIFIDSETSIIKDAHGAETEIEYNIFKKLEIL